MLIRTSSKRPNLETNRRVRTAGHEALECVVATASGGMSVRIARPLLSGWALFALLLVCSACSRDDSPPQHQSLEVVATYSILGDLVRQVGGDRVSVRTLVGPDGDAHTFEPTPRDSVALYDAQLVFENGLGFESWLDDLFDASGSTAGRIVVTRSIEARAVDPADESTDPDDHQHGHGTADHAGHDDHAESAHDHDDHGKPADRHDHDDHVEHADGHGGHDDHVGHADGHDHGELDPHVWHDVPNAIAMVTVVADALMAADPANATAYDANRARYVGELRELDAWVHAQVQTIPVEQRILVTSHDTFGYFAEQYGFRTVTVLGSVSSEIQDPSAAAVVDVVEQIQATGVTAVFAENVLGPRLTEQIARQAKVRVVATLYTDALGAADTEGASYVGMIRHNVRTLVEGLR